MSKPMVSEVGCNDGFFETDGTPVGGAEGTHDKEGTEVGEVLGSLVMVGPVDGDLLSNTETDGSKMCCDDGFFETDGIPEGSSEGALDKEGTADVDKVLGSVDELLQVVGDAVREGAIGGSTETEGPLDKEGTEVGEVLGRSVVVGPPGGDSLGDVETNGFGSGLQ